MNKPKLWSKDFISVSLSNFFLFLTFYILLVTLPSYAMEELHSSSSMAGLMTTVFLLSAIVSRPLAGQWLERSGNKKVLLTALIIFASASLLYFFPTTISGFLVIRLLHGIGFGMATTAVGTIVADIIPASRRGEGMGYFVMSTNMAMVIGPFVGLLAIQQWGPQILFSLSVIVAIASLLTGLSVKHTKTEQPSKIEVLSTSSFHRLFEASAVPIAIVGSFMAIVYSALLSFVSIYAHEIHLASVASLFFVVYAIVLLISRPFTGKWLDQYGPNVISYPCIALFAIGMFILSQSSGVFTFLLSAGMIGLGWGTLFPTFQTIAIQDAEPRKRGVATATFLSIYDTGIALGSFLVGVIAAKMDYSSLYFFCSFYILFGAVLYYFLHTRKQASSTKVKKQQTKMQEI
ncbi:Staphylopine export protein [Neobacillus rhizosphaerae]|uniref:Staphylopine export protein n=1 Tax=Neobacillus rhizosphaerae TaxID=2880965 RepID=A0ABM9EQF3_9BACI|nr:MFS transporter [Neobacillus rhizosphaerae]CAH2714867.1 Staphylopine export protein [Neobacillus rhizosphaerae]